MIRRALWRRYTAPTLSFLYQPKGLIEAAEPTVKSCKALLDMLPAAKTPQEKHDIIDSVSNLLCLHLDPCEFVRQVHPVQEYRDAAAEAFQITHQFLCETNSRRDLYDHLMTMAQPEAKAQLTDESQKNLAQLIRDMEGNGIHLPAGRRQEIVELNIEKENLAMQFLMTDRNSFATLRNLVQCRYELARKLDFECFADQQLRGCMLDTPQQVWHFLCAVANKYRAPAEKEAERLRLHQGEVRGRHNITDEDRAKLSVSLQREFHASGIERYFSVANCVRGIQILCEEVFGVKLKPMPLEKEEVLGADFRKFHAFDDQGEFLGVIIIDMFARLTKACQAGHLTVQLGCRPHQGPMAKLGLPMPERQYPVVVLTCNAGSERAPGRNPDGTCDDETTLMMPHEVTTCFHEFGHALHTLFGQTTVQNLAGTRGSIDYVECFSQLFEQFLTSHEFLKLWAHEIGSRKPIPMDLVMRRNETNNMFRHLDTLDQVMLASIDQTLHGPQPMTVYFPTVGGNLGKRTLGSFDDYGRGIFNTAKLLIDVCTPISVVTPTERGVLRSLSLEHLSSYPAGYYGYLYSGAFAKRIWSKNFLDKPLNRKEGKRLADEMLRHGAACNQRDAMRAYLREDIDDLETWI